MKRVVFLNDLKESDIRPEVVYNEYKQLLSKDIQAYFSDFSVLVKVDCPGCSSDSFKGILETMGFNYCVCNSCGSLFISPRPNEEKLRSFYKNSDTGIFLRKIVLGNTLESRSKKVFSYRIQWIMGLVEEYFPEAKVFLDYATRYPTFLNELKDTGIFQSILSASPECYEQENLLPQNLKKVDACDMADESIDIFAAFETVERVFDPASLFKDAYRVCRKNGLLVITSTVSSGFEYQVLGKYSPNLIPFDRLNILSLEALTRRIRDAGFEIIEVSTPGRLDVEMVKKAYEKNPDIPLDSFWKYIFHNRDENALHSLQEYLQQFQLSSHVRIAAIKKVDTDAV